MDNNKSMHRVLKALCLFVVSQVLIMLLLNLLPSGGNCEWASVCREWIECIMGLR